MHRARSQAFDKEGLRCGALLKAVECGALSGARTDVSIEPLASKYCLSAFAVIRRINRVTVPCFTNACAETPRWLYSTQDRLGLRGSTRRWSRDPLAQTVVPSLAGHRGCCSVE